MPTLLEMFKQTFNYNIVLFGVSSPINNVILEIKIVICKRRLTFSMV